MTWPAGMQAARNAYVQNRVGVRMKSRGEPMILRRVNKMAGPVPYVYPPDISADLTVHTGVVATDGHSYLGLAGATINGRLIAGDLLTVGAVTWTAQTMPNTIATDSDGIALAGIDGQPVFATPTLYTPDILAANNAFSVVPVTAPGNPPPSASIGLSVAFTFSSDSLVYGRTLSLQEMVLRGWTQVNSLGINIAAEVDGVPVAPPAVDDLLILGGEVRSIMSVAPVFSRGVNFLFSLQCR